MKRRDFTKIFATSFLASVSCNRPKIDLTTKVKPTEQPTFENIIEYCTTFPYLDLPIPLLIETSNGIPFGITGYNNTKTLNLVTPAFALASRYVLFDKHRITFPTIKGKPVDKPFAFKYIFSMIDDTIAKNKKIAIITNHINSPYLQHLISEIKEINRQILILELPIFEFYKQQVRANRILFKRDLFLIPKIERKKIIVNFGCDFLSNDPFSVTFVTQFKKNEQTLFTFEDALTLTGINSEIRVPASESTIFNYALTILKFILEKHSVPFNHITFEKLNKDNQIELPEHIKREISNHLESIVFICNPYYAMEIQLLTNLLNFLCSEINKSHFEKNFSIVDLEEKSNQTFDYSSYVSNIEDFGMTFFVNYNPYFSLNNKLISLIEEGKVKNIIQLSLYQNELTNWCYIFIPLQTFMEHWGDYQQIDGSILAQQKLVQPINKNSAADFEFFYELRKHLKQTKQQDNYSTDLMNWYASRNNPQELIENLHTGLFLPSSSDKKQKLELQKSNLNKALSNLNHFEQKETTTRKLKIYPSLLMYSGEYSKNIYLYELPDPLSAVVWQSPIFSSNSMNGQGNLKAIKIKTEKGEIKLPSFAYNELNVQNDFYIYTNYDYLKRFFNIESPHINPFFVEFDNSYYIKILDYHFEKGTELTKVKRNSFQATFDILSPMEDDVKINSYEKSFSDTNFSNELQWSMIIDIDKCIGCNLCMLACQIENNIPVVGEKFISQNRDLYWINVLKLSTSEKVHFLPLMCQHCDYAPCESVCPVGATSHSSEGINEMTYNKCIGSRFCMVNCPYDARKFNFLHPEKSHIQYIPEIMNPWVTVRSRGVSEKCTFCIHKINFAKRKAKLFGEGNDFLVQTACQAACPVQAIEFGRKKQILNKEKKHHLFVLLQNFNTHPNVYYKSTQNEQAKS